MTKNWKRNLIGGLSFTSMLFIFQACYGTPHDVGYDVLVEGNVKSKTTGQPIKGIKVAPYNDIQQVFTDENGNFSFYILADYSIGLRFEDVDSTLNGGFASKDTVLTNLTSQVFVNIALDSK